MTTIASSNPIHSASKPRFYRLALCAVAVLLAIGASAQLRTVAVETERSGAPAAAYQILMNPEWPMPSEVLEESAPTAESIVFSAE